MFGFFNSRNRLSAALQLTNAAGFILTAYDYYTNPDAQASVSFPQMTNYAFNVYNLSANASVDTRIPGALLNIFSVGAIYRDFTSACSTVSTSLNALAAMNLLTTVLNIIGLEDKSEPAAAPKA